MVSNEPGSVSVEGNYKYGIGGGDDDDEAVPDTEVKKNSIAASITGQNVFERLDHLDNNLQLLIINLQNKKERLDATPSIFPVEGIITSPFGYRTNPLTNRREFHRGIDILNDLGTPVISPAKGIVKEVTRNSIWGRKVTIDHGYGMITEYGHLHDISVTQNQELNRGDIIGHLGSTGRATGPHLHYQVWLNGKVKDPLMYIIDDSIY